MWFLVILNALAKNIIPPFALIRQKSFLEKTKKGGWARDFTTEGGSGGHPPRHSHVHHHLQKPERIELHPICLPVGLSVSVSYRPSSVGIFGMVLVLSGVTNAANSIRSPYLGGI